MDLLVLCLLALCSCIGAKTSSAELQNLQKELIAELVNEFQSRLKRSMSTSPMDILSETTEESEIDAEEEASDSSSESTVKETRDITDGIHVIPGLHYPNFVDIPDTSFTCSDKPYIPGFYADIDTGCQVFHVCWPHMRESFLCPIGATFNQKILACDHWYNSKCSPSQHYYDVNAVLRKYPTDGEKDSFASIIESVIDQLNSQSLNTHESQLSTDIQHVLNLLPVKARVTAYPDVRDTSNLKAEPRVGMFKPQKFTQIKREQAVTPKYFLAIGKVLKQLAADIEATPKYSLIVMKLLNKFAPEIMANTSPFQSDFGSVAINAEEKFAITIILLMAKLIVIASEILAQ